MSILGNLIVANLSHNRGQTLILNRDQAKSLNSDLALGLIRGGLHVLLPK